MGMQKLKTSAFLDGVDESNNTNTWNLARLNDNANGFTPMDFGGSNIDGITGSGVKAIINPHVVRFDATQQTLSNGYTFIARVKAWTETTAGSFTPEIWDVTNSTAEVLSIAGTAVTSTSGTWQDITLASHPGGIRRYELRANKANALLAWCHGSFERSVP